MKRREELFFVVFGKWQIDLSPEKEIFMIGRFPILIPFTYEISQWIEVVIKTLRGKHFATYDNLFYKKKMGNRCIFIKYVFSQ